MAGKLANPDLAHDISRLHSGLLLLCRPPRASQPLLIQFRILFASVSVAHQPDKVEIDAPKLFGDYGHV